MREPAERDGLQGVATRRQFLAKTLAAGGALAVGSPEWARSAERSKPPEMNLVRQPDKVQVRYGTRELCTYQLRQPFGSGIPVSSACYFHPLQTPGGIPVTEVGPDDHRHHRGVFFGWVEMIGSGKKSDFWGWGEKAPIKGRQIVNQGIETSAPGLGYIRFRALNEWQVDGARWIAEDLRAGVALIEGATALELTVQLSVAAPVTLARSAFGGLAVRLRKDAKIQPIGPGGPVTLAPPKHTEPESNWPEATWYGLHSTYSDGKQSTVVVIGRKTHPPTNWHVVPGIGLINPSITGPGAVEITPERPLVLRYRVMAFDGAPRPAVIAKLADSWYNGRQ
ncbi:MAG: DUF6807 family protein [Limisphaerales bacterium]